MITAIQQAKQASARRAASRPRVLHMFNSFLVGGVEKQHYLLVRQLHDRFDQECWALDDGPIAFWLGDMGIRTHCGPAQLARTIIEQGGYDCIILRTNRILKDLSAFLRDFPVPVVYTRNYLRWSAEDAQHINPEFEHLGLAAADRCLFSGPSLMEPLKGQLVSSQAGEIIFNGLELHRFPMRPKTVSAAGRPLQVGMLANLLPNKNQLKAVEAMGEGLRQGDYELLLAGAPFNASYADEVGRKAEGLPVRLLGRVDDTVAFLKRLDVLLVASTLEGWPNAIMEAFACGVPVVSHSVGDIPILFGWSLPGRLYPLDRHDQIPRLLEEIRLPEEYARLSRSAVERARAFDIRTSAAVLERAVLSVLDEQAESTTFSGTRFGG